MQKILNIISLTLNSLILLFLLIIAINSFITVNSAESIGIIGGSDGPTAVFYSSPFPFLLPVGITILVLIIYEIVFLLNLRSKKTSANG